MMIDLKQLPQIQALFKRLSSGVHLNRLQDNELWVELENHLNLYKTLFAALGYILVMDGRGFAYFKTDQVTPSIGKFSRQIALLLMLLFEYQADQGLHLFQFEQWRLDSALIYKLCRQYNALLEAEEIGNTQALKEILDKAARIGFLVSEDGTYRLLPAVYRYLDLFQELTQAERNDPMQTEDDAEDKL